MDTLAWLSMYSKYADFFFCTNVILIHSFEISNVDILWEARYALNLKNLLLIVKNESYLNSYSQDINSAAFKLENLAN